MRDKYNKLVNRFFRTRNNSTSKVYGSKQIKIELNKIQSKLENIDLTKQETASKELDVLKVKLETLKNSAKELQIKYDKYTLIYTVIFTPLIFVLITQLILPDNVTLNINSNYYEAVVQLIPVLLIALYVSGSDKLLNNVYSVTSELIGKIIPAFAGIFACLITLASDKSNNLLFVITIYAVTALSVSWVIELCIDEIKKSR